MNRAKTLGKYELSQEIGRGNMGRVYLGYDPYVDRRVAIKLANADQLRDEEMGSHYRRQFFNAAHMAGLLAHPNIVAIHDAGVNDEDCYIVMEHIEGGRTLKDHCRPETLLPIDKVVEVCFKIAKALDYAHRQGVVHRDIKPSNILVCPDMDVKLGDFGIAFVGRQEATGTIPSVTLGSPRYMSPEQLKEDTLSGQTDVFSLGVVMYELLTGRHPFAADSFTRLIFRILHEEPPPMNTLRAGIPESLEVIMRRAICKQTSQRYRSAMEMAADLSRAFDRVLEHPTEEIAAGEMFGELLQLEFFRGFNDVELWELVRAGEWQEFTPNSEIVIEGDIDDSFYVIIKGEVSVRRQGYDLRVLKRGDCFGELGYLAQTARIATIVARTDTSLLKLSASMIEQVSVGCQNRFLKSFLRILIQRLSIKTDLFRLPSAVA
ncbi:MAG: serine/threonine-protein kinase [Gammaproteobacteria bacterium]